MNAQSSGTTMVLVVKVLQEVYYHTNSCGVNQQIMRYFFHCGYCPQCGKKVDMLIAVCHEGFCDEQHYRSFIQKYGYPTCSYLAQSALAEYEQSHRDSDSAEIVSYIFEHIAQGATFTDVANTRISIPQEYMVTRGPEQIVEVTPFVINHYLEHTAV